MTKLAIIDYSATRHGDAGPARSANYEATKYLPVSSQFRTIIDSLGAFGHRASGVYDSFTSSPSAGPRVVAVRARFRMMN